MSSADCPFCERVETGDDLILQDPKLVAFHDQYPVSEGHTLIIPRDHLTSLDETLRRLGPSLSPAISRVMEYLKNEFSPDGFNVGFNSGEAAGQTIDHVHCHVIPRYEGDVEDPTGGIRGVIPDQRRYP